jgi:hypothetical protein
VLEDRVRHVDGVAVREWGETGWAHRGPNWGELFADWLAAHA